MATKNEFIELIKNRPGITTSEIEEELKISRNAIINFCSSTPDSIHVIKDGRNSRHYPRLEQLIYDEVSIGIDSSFPTKQIIHLQYDVMNTTPDMITDIRAFTCDHHKISKKNIGNVFLNDGKIAPNFITLRPHNIRYTHTWYTGNNRLSANYECKPDNYYRYDTAFPVQKLNLKLYTKMKTPNPPAFYRLADEHKVAEMAYIERTGNYYHLELQKIGVGSYELRW